MATQTDKDKRMSIEQASGTAGEPGGSITMDENVVKTIAGLAARNIHGVHSLGKPRLVTFGDSPTRGVDAEVGEKEAAIDLDITIEYGCDLRETASELRKLIAEEIDRMAGRKVVEVNINVHDVHLEEPESSKAKLEEPRVH